MAITQVPVFQNLADDATYDLSAGARGWFEAMLGNKEHFVKGTFKNDGTITLISSSANVSLADENDKFCIFNNAGTPRFKNRTGALEVFVLNLKYGDAANIIINDAVIDLSDVDSYGNFMAGDDDHFGSYYVDNTSHVHLTAASELARVTDQKQIPHFLLERFTAVNPRLKNVLGAATYLNYEQRTGTTVSIVNGALELIGVLGAGFGTLFVKNNQAIKQFAEFIFDDDGNNIEIISSTERVSDSDAEVGMRIYGGGSATDIGVRNSLGSDEDFIYELFEIGSAPVLDTDADAKHWIDSGSENNVTVSWEKPPEAAWDYSKLYRKSNAAAEQYLLDDGTWDVAGAAWEFDAATDEGELAWIDRDVGDAKFRYRVTQVASTGYESSGTAITIYVDEPVVAVALVDGTPTTVRGIRLDLSGDSGDDSLNTAGEVDRYLVWCDDEAASAGIMYETRTTSTYRVPFYINTATGAKIINCQGYDSGGQSGAISTVNITLSTVVIPEAPVVRGKIMFGYYAISDDVTVISNSTDAESDPGNVQDQRPGVVWQGESIDDVSGALTAYYKLALSFSGAREIDIFYLKNHNMDSSRLSGASSLHLCGESIADPSPGGANWTPQDWLNNATYKVDLSDAAGRDLIVHRPEVTHEHWAVIAKAVVANTANAELFQPHIGRIGLVRSSDIWQPASGDFSFTWSQETKDNSTLNETDDGVLESTDRETQEILSLQFKNMTRDDYEAARQRIAREVKQSRGIIILPRPEEIDTSDNAPSASDEYTAESIYAQVIGNTRLTGGQAGLMNFNVSLREMAGGEE